MFKVDELTSFNCCQNPVDSSLCELLLSLVFFSVRETLRFASVKFKQYLTVHHEEDQLTSIRHIRRLTHPTRTANLGSGSGANNTSSTSGGGSGSAAVSRSSRAAMMQLIELPSLSGAGLSAAGRDPMDPIAG